MFIHKSGAKEQKGKKKKTIIYILFALFMYDPFQCIRSFVAVTHTYNALPLLLLKMIYE